MSNLPEPAHWERQLLQASSEILLLIDADSLTILAANPATFTLLGYSQADLLGQPIGLLECALFDLFFWDEMQGQNAVREVESSFLCQDGQVLAVAKSVQKLPGQPQRYVLRAVPVGSQNWIESELSNMGSRLRATLEATADGILLVDHEGVIINMNQRFSAMWGLGEALLLQRDDAAVMQFMQSQYPQPAPSSDEDGCETLHLHDGRVFECRVHNANAGKEIIGRVYSYRDVSERHRSQQELLQAHDAAKRASAAKGDFLAMMSHEIRTPMNGVLGISELLATTPLNAEQADYVRVIRSSGETLLAIINDILDFSKIEAGKLSLEQTSFSVQTMLEEVNALFRNRVLPGGPRFSCQCDPVLPALLRGDPVRLRQILFNLVGNAFKFTEQGEIAVRVTLLPGAAAEPAAAAAVGLRFSVRDSGIGLTPEQVGRLFRSFEQADQSTTRKYGGTGLGLAICKRLAELMGGEIGVNSVAGQGSEFWFNVYLGAVQAEAASPQLGSAAPACAPALVLTPAVRVLVVEDHPVNRMVIRGLLKRLGGAEPVLAENGQEALQCVAAGRFDVILMDIQMPLMDGIEATQRLRAAGLTTPILGLSAGALEGDIQAALGAGMDDYVLKPVDLQTLSAALLRALGPVSPAG